MHYTVHLLMLDLVIYPVFPSPISHRSPSSQVALLIYPSDHAKYVRRDFLHLMGDVLYTSQVFE